MDIEYYEKDGRIGIRYTPDYEAICLLLEIDSNDECLDRNVGLVPKVVQKQGRKAIQRYAAQACDNDLKRLRFTSKRKARQRLFKMRNVDYSLLVEHKDGTVLRGRITNATSDIKVVVKLEEPYQCSTEPYIDPTCHASSVAGYRTFDIDDGSLTQWAIQDAKETLVSLYEEEKNRCEHGDVVRLVEGLNKGKQVNRR